MTAMLVAGGFIVFLLLLFGTVHLYRQGHRLTGKFETDVHRCSTPELWGIRNGTVWRCRWCGQRWVARDDPRSYGRMWMRKGGRLDVEAMEKELGMGDGK